MQRVKLFIESYQEKTPLAPEEKRIIFELPCIASLYPIFLLKTRYIRNSTKADSLMPKDPSYWNWWNDNYLIVKNYIF